MTPDALVKAITILGPATILAQVAPLVVPLGTVENISKMGLITALVVAVVWLANFLVKMMAANKVELAAMMAASDAKIAAKDAKIAEKDQQLMSLTADLTKTMVLVLEAVKEQRAANEEARKSSDELGIAVDNLTSNIIALPCAMDSALVERAEKAERTDLVHRRGSGK